MGIKGFSNKITELEGIRGLACLFVVIHHYFTEPLTFKLTGMLGILTKISGVFFVSGVDLFWLYVICSG